MSPKTIFVLFLLTVVLTSAALADCEKPYKKSLPKKKPPTEETTTLDEETLTTLDGSKKPPP
ncbi:hypothetical protein ACJRO7_029818 [Eucalyptus globulus]|uniref:Uncharacterized protein n=1 Tax=Eucalyptus globulus TaxID=34317 RepID=A0ABD3JCE0_EUCGL